MKVLLMTLVLVLLLAGCAAGQGDGAGSATTQEGTTSNGAEETTVQKRTGDRNRPPDSTLFYGAQLVTGTLGSYCWGDMCADSFFIVPPRKKTLTVPSGSHIVFDYGGQRPPIKVGVGAVPLDKQGTSTASPNLNRERSLKVHGSGVDRTIPVELPPGEYVVEVFIEEQQGDAGYYFRVLVE